jgi:hypothetical protein
MILTLRAAKRFVQKSRVGNSGSATVPVALLRVSRGRIVGVTPTIAGETPALPKNLRGEIITTLPPALSAREFVRFELRLVHRAEAERRLNRA